MVAQDTGSAIVGPARADIYFGAGDEAARMAGRIRKPGRFVMLLPRALDPVEAGRSMPLPLERPKPEEVRSPMAAPRAFRPGRSSRRGHPAAGRKAGSRARTPDGTCPALVPADAPLPEPVPTARPKKRRRQ